MTSQPVPTMGRAPGLIVEAITPGSVAEKVGIYVGNRLLSYAGQALCSPTHLQALEENTVGVQPVLLKLEREGQERELRMTGGNLGLSVRSELSAEVMALYQQASQEKEAGRKQKAAQQLEQAAQHAKESLVAAWLYLQAGNLYTELSDLEMAGDSYHAALEFSQQAEDRACQVLVLLGLGRCWYRRDAFEKADEWFQQAYNRATEASWPLWAAISLTHLGTVALDRGDLATAQDYLARALTLQEQLAPGSLEMSRSLTSLGRVAEVRGDFASAQTYYARALAIREQLAPGSLNVAASLTNLGRLAHDRGDLATAQTYYARALALQEQLAPGSLLAARSLEGLGHVGLKQQRYQQALIMTPRIRTAV